MDKEDAQAQTPSRNSGENRDSNDASSRGNSSQKRKRNNAKKRRRASASGAGDDTKPTTGTGDDKTVKLTSEAGDLDEEKRKDATQDAAEDAAATSAEWGCPACTYLNDALRRFCEMCGAGNPTKPAKEAVPTEWSCVACTMKNAPTSRACGVCGTINPNPPAMPSILSIARRSLHGGLLFGAVEDEDDDDDDDEDSDGDDEDGDGDGSSGSGSSSDTDGEQQALECPCVECGATVGADESSCQHCHAPRPLPRRKLKRSSLSARLQKLTQKMAKKDKKSKKTKSKEASSKSPSLKNAYGVSSEVLKKLMAEPTSSKLFDTLQTLTHTLAMMDASADGEWGDMHGVGGAGGFLIHGFGGSGRSDKGKDTALLGVLASIFREESSPFPVEVRLFAVQSINYLLKMDRHLFKKDDAVEAVRIFLAALKKWSVARRETKASVRPMSKDEQMIVEECVNGLCGLCGSESGMLRELMQSSSFEDFLDFLGQLSSDQASGLHTTTMTSSLELFQKCCSRIKWDGSSDGKATNEDAQASNPKTIEDQQVELAKRVVTLLRSFLKHPQTALHVNASKCMLLLFNRIPRDQQKSKTIVSALVNADMILELVALLTSKNAEEPDDSRQAAASLLIHLLDNRPEMLELVVRNKIYDPLLDGVVDLLQQPNVKSTLVTHALKLVSLLIRRVCRTPATRLTKSRTTTPGSPEPRNRLRLDSSPDPDVLANLLLDFIRADSIPAVSTLLKDGADLNFPTIHDASGREVEKPLVVAADVASLAMVRFLVTRGVDVRQTGVSGTALHVAVAAGRCDVVSFLLECGASPTDVDRAGRTVLQCLDEVDASISDCSTTPGASPVRKLLELHQRVVRMGEDSDGSDDEMHHHHGFAARRWAASGGHHPFEGDVDEDDFDEDEDQYYMDDDDDDDDDELDSDEDDEMSSGDEEGESVKKPAAELKAASPGEKKKKRRRESVGSDANDGKTSKRSRQSANGKLSEEAAASSPSHKKDAVEPVQVTPEQVCAFSDKILRSLLQTLRAVDHQNVNRAVLSTLASSLEMAPSKLVRSIPDADISLLLETVNHLLQDPAMYVKSAQSTIVASSSPSNDGKESEPTFAVQSTQASAAAAQASQKAMLASYILALRILQAIVRKSAKESSVFYEIERRGICEQIERLHAHSIESVVPPSENGSRAYSSARNGGLFGRGLQLLEYLRANMVESGMLHLHRLKNMTRRLKELTETTPAAERDMVLVDLVELFEQENSITSHEFKQSSLLEAILAFLVPPHRVDPSASRVALLLEHFSKSPEAFRSLVARLQAVVNQEEDLPMVSYFAGKGRELYPLTKQLKIVCSRIQQEAEKNKPVVQKMLQLSPLTHFQSFEKTIFRCMPVKDAKLSSFYFSLVGHRIHRAVDGKWKKFWVCGYDSQRGVHLVRPEDDAAQELTEVVLHDAQYKLSDCVDVYDGLSLNFDLFGKPLVKDSPSQSGDDKKRKRQSKKRRKMSTSSSAEATDLAVEVHNTAGVNAGKMKGAWYAGEIVEDASSSSGETPSTTIQAGREYTVRLLSSGKILKKVSADSLRVRNDAPQVGSVVEVDGLLGEVTRVESTGDGDDSAGDIFDVRVSRDRERKGIKKHRIRYPPSGSSTPSSSTTPSSGVIEAMSLSRLFPPRESSLAAGSVGDNVWVPPLAARDESSSSGDLFVSGKIHSFPAGPDAVGPSASVFVELTFGHETAVVKVEQSRVINLSNGRSRLGSSRLLSALQTASERGGSSGLPLHRLLQSAAEGNELFGNRSHSGSSSTLDHLRQLLSQSSSSSRDSAWAGLLNNASTDSTTAAASSVSSDGDTESKKQVKPKERDAPARLAHVWSLIDTGEKKCTWICNRPPKVSLLLGYERCENMDAAGFERNYEEEFGASSVLFPSKKKSNEVSLTEIDPVTKKQALKPKVVEALSSVFESFDAADKATRGSSSKHSKKGKKKRKLSMQTTDDATDGKRKKVAAWDVDKFSAFTAAAIGDSGVDDPEGTMVDNCVQFSLFATPSSKRRELDLDGFLAAVLDMCKSLHSARHLFAYLVSHGYCSASQLVGDSKPASASKTSSEKADPKTGSTNALEMKAFTSDQNMLKCLVDMQQQDARIRTASPPWKLKYYVQCDISVDWSAAVKRDGLSDEDSSTSVHLRGITGVASDSAMMKSVRLLSYLYEAHAGSQIQMSEDVWRNAKLAKKLETQLEDVLSVCSGVYPDWCDAVVSECKFFFPRELREKLFQATSFGCTRSLHWFRNQLNMEDAAGTASTSDSLATGGGIAADGTYNHEISISPIPKERVKVNRDNILNSAEAVMKMHGKRKAILDIVFIGEKGYGSGVTAAFYSATAQALQSIEENRKEQTRCWVSGIEDEREDLEIRHPNGLFPFPHVSSPAPAKIVERFRMMGRLSGKALMDGRLFPLPLSTQFMKLVLGQRVGVEELEQIFLGPGKVIKSMKRVIDKIAAGVDATTIQIDGMQAADWLEATGFTFIDPLSQKPLQPNGDETDVTLDNLKAYVDKVVSFWLEDGIRAQVEAFREGIRDVLPLEKLKLLFIPELLSLLCGDADILWDTESLLTSMKLAHGYTKDSTPIKFFIDSLAEMNVRERREFLLYSTGCPNLPAGGFQALKPPFEVVRRVVDTDNVNQALPFARTCTNTLHLPAYSSKQIMDERLRYAIANSAGVIDRD